MTGALEQDSGRDSRPSGHMFVLLSPMEAEAAL